MLSIPFVALHTGHGVTLAEYLFRVLGHLLAVTGLGVAILWGVRVAGLVRSAIDGRGAVDENDSELG